MKKFLLMLTVLLTLSLTITGCANSNNDEAIETVKDLKDYAGIYQDSYSGRATMEITYDDALHANIIWGDSAASSGEWSLDFELKDDKFFYTDGLYEHCTYDSDGTRHVDSSKTVSGYFQIYNDLLLWTGSSDEYARECTFGLIPME